MSQSRNNPSASLCLFVAVLMTMTASGCLHALGLARPSIGPRAAISSNSDSTIRAQDGLSTTQTTAGTLHTNDPPITLGSVQNSPLGHAGAGSPARSTASAAPGTQTPSGGMRPSHSISAATPNVRLLTPQFSRRSAPVSTATQTVTTNLGSHAGPVQEAARPKPTLGFNAGSVRAFLNRQSRNEMSEGRVLTERPDRWKVIASEKKSQLPIRTAVQTAIQPRAGVAAPAVSNARMISNSNSNRPEFGWTTGTESDSLSASEGREQLQTPAVSVESGSEPSTEPTMLDRLKGIYEPATENVARKIWKRPFQKLSSPWAAVFGDRDQETSPPEETAAEPSLADREAPSASSAVSPSSARDSQDLLRELVAATETQLRNWPQGPSGKPERFHEFQRRQQDLRLMYLIADQPGRAIQAVEELPDIEQNFWQELMLAIAEYRSDDEQPQNRFTNTTGQLRSAVQVLAPLTSLSVRRFEVCSRIRSFGRIDPLMLIVPGQRILLYAEVENVASELTAEGTHRTRFEAQLTLFEEGNTEPRETVELSDITDESSSERSDYYQSFELNLPSHLTSGEYLVRLRLRDRISGRTAESFVGFRVDRNAPVQ